MKRLVVFTLLLMMTAVAGCGKPSSNIESKEIGSVTIPKQDTLKMQQIIKIEPFELTVGGYNLQVNSTPIELKNIANSSISNLRIFVVGQGTRAELFSNDASLNISEDRQSALIGNFAPTSTRIFSVSGLPKDQFELYAEYDDNKTLKIYPKEQV